ncbi:hypothetical protein ABTX81_24400 [Kitasatospora sp. NPDC097605]|uniref:hypothetical protein n=1 Tax=Kitasatospora sp. NPDC097605 TaxID=3157226 RepID=UPI003316647C
MRHDDTQDDQDHIRLLLAAGLGAEPPLRAGTVEAAMAAGRRRGGGRVLARTGVGAGVTAALAALVMCLGSAAPAPASAGGPTVTAADPLTGPVALVGETGEVPQALRPDSFGASSDRPTGWSSERLGATLAGLLPSGAADVRAGDIAGRTFRVVWNGAAGPVEFIGGAERSADAPKVPLCATVAFPKITPAPGHPRPEEVLPKNRCELVDLPGGGRAEAVTLTFPQGGRTSQYVRVLRGDGRTVTLQQFPERPEGSLDTAALLAIANDPAWRF